MRRIVVTQTDARNRGGLRDPLEVGVVRWRGAGDELAVVVRMSLDLSAAEPEVTDAHPLSRRAEDDKPSDFVLFKPRCDFLITGHAHAQEPSDRIDVVVSLVDLTRSLTAVAGEPAPSIPLTPDHLRDGEGKPVSFAPLPVEREGEDVGYDAFEHASVQCASPMMQLEPLGPGAKLEITGLSARAEQRSFALPKLAPRVWVEGRGVLTPLELRCDTVLLDTDFERLDLTWRAVIPDAAREVNRVFASLERSDVLRTTDTIARELPRGTVVWATEETDIAAHDEELEMASYEVLEHCAEPEMSLEEFADVSAKLSEQDRPREEILDDLEIEERAWGIEERAWVEKMGEHANAGDGALTAEFATFFLAAQDRLKKPGEPKSMETYTSVKAELERANKPNELLKERKLCFGEWMRLERHWSDKAAKDPAVGEELKKMLQAARAAQTK